MPRLFQAREILRFEFLTQVRHPAFWLSVVACVAAGVAFGATDLGALEAAPGRLARNVPMGVASGLAGLSAVGMLVALVLVGTAGLREVSSGIGPLVFSSPVRPASYLVGKLLGATGAVVLAVAAGSVAMAATHAFRAGSDSAIGPGSVVPWAYGVIFFVLPNLLFISTFVFLAALVTRRIGTTFLAILPVIVGQDIAEALGASHPTWLLPPLMDPMGIAALQGATRLWTVAQFEQELPPLVGPLLGNRVLWAAITLGLGLGAASVLRARARLTGGGRRGKKGVSGAGAGSRHEDHGSFRQVPPAPFGGATSLRQALSIARFEFLRWSRGLVFPTLLIAGAAIVVYSLVDGERVLGVAGLPGSRGIMLALERGTRLTMTLLVVLLTGELVWRERLSGIDATVDAYPASRAMVAFGKVAALASVITIMVTVFALLAWSVQAALSGDAAPFGHVAALVGHSVLGAFQLAAVALLLQILAGGPTLGYLLVGVVLAGRIALGAMGLTGSLYSLQGLRLPELGQLEGFGPGEQRTWLTHAYWTALALCLVGLVIWFWPRGLAGTWRERIGQAKRRMTVGGSASLVAMGTLTALLGIQLYGRTEAPGAGWTRVQLREARASYEHAYGHLREAQVPSVDSIRGDVELDSAGGTLQVSGTYRLVHQGAEPLVDLLISHEPDLALVGLVRSTTLPSSVPTTVIGKPGTAPGTQVIRFDPPLAPGETTHLAFALSFEPSGWGRRPTERWLRKNGSFLLGGTGTHEFFHGAQLFPKLGYDQARELRSTRDREHHGLPPWSPGVTPEEYSSSSAANRAANDWADLDLWVHTADDEVALAPGELVEDSTSLGRRHQHFVSEERIPAMFPIICGRYEVARAEHGGTLLEVYHAPEHGARVPHMLWAIQRSLAYFEAHWGPYPHASLRVAEVPGGATFACSFPGVMAFAEGMAFTQPKGDGGPIPMDRDEAAHSVDPILWLVAHEVAHQWWNGQVVAAPVLGGELVSESLAQYGAVCVIDAVYGDEVTASTARHHRERYLRGRSRSDRGERPLVHVDDQAHLHYGKGLLAFHTLARMFGLEPIDRALRGLIDRHGGAHGRPLMSTEVLAALERELPPEAGEALETLFRRIRFQEARVESATYRPEGDGAYRLVVEGTVRGVEADARGAEFDLPYTGSVQIQITMKSGESCLADSKPVQGGRLRIECSCAERPASISLDPNLLLIDRDLTDNEVPAIEAQP